MRRRECYRVQKQMEGWETTPPDWAQAHIAGCPRCAEAWHWQQRYRRALQSARHTPVPTCSLPWERVQAQLAARAVRQRTLRWQFAFATTFATGFAMIAIIGLLLVNRGEQGLWRMNRSERGTSPMRIAQLPPHATSPLSTPAFGGKTLAKAEGSFSKPSAVPHQRRARKSLAMDLSRPVASPMLQERARRAIEGGSEPLFRQADRVAEAQYLGLEGMPATTNWALNRAFQREEPAVALLPLPSMAPESGESAEYLPVQYGGDESHAYSF
jgi:hypothetical protein